ncbi:Sec-independent protein translocase protein TatB [Paracoccus bogoriensis]|uniref:Sec-independent protein translocase protein TatB n=1 Tax=Paracoccus bogoriensis TaxID=242065 RepID=UPI001CA4A1D9|nr:Sec-independent protein translocase protein TatB [Paracoccus bogoriensis]MBW7057760.1 Sec-independent protein translocase protein TatB [Paracoccus bogoriensis]
MLDIGWTELLLIGIVALIVVGPKDLPHLFHSLGRITARLRGLAREFSSAMEDAARGSGLDEAAGTLRDVKSLTSKRALGLDALDRATERFEKWEPGRPARHQDAPRPDPSAPAPPMSAAPDTSVARQPSASGSVPVAGAAAEAAARNQGRRLHAVRRSDMKDL